MRKRVELEGLKWRSRDKEGKEVVNGERRGEVGDWEGERMVIGKNWERMRMGMKGERGREMVMVLVKRKRKRGRVWVEGEGEGLDGDRRRGKEEREGEKG
jgi:hypothetical protein